jgi:RNA polymerase sigma factor (TIGR02999 family)
MTWLAPEDPDDNKVSYQSVYRELRRRARYFLSGERPGHTLQPTEVVHEVWIRMKSVDPSILASREEFLALAAKVMRNLLVDYARGKKAARRGGARTRVELSPEILFSEDNTCLILEIDELLKQLAEVDQRAATVVEMKFFAGLTDAEIGETLSVSSRTVKRDWDFAKTWIRRILEQPDDDVELQDGLTPTPAI